MAGIEGLAKREKANGKIFFQTLRGHTYDALKILKAYLENHMDVVEEFCRLWNIDKETFLRNLFVIVYLHDIGKLTEQFQRNIRQGKHSTHYPHAYFFLHLFEDFPDKKVLDDVPVEILAVLGHHTELHESIYGSNENINTPKFLVDEIKEFVGGISMAYDTLGFSSFFSFSGIDIPEIRRYRSGAMRKKRNNLINHPRSTDFSETVRWKAVFSYFFSLLQTCDDYSSANFAEFVKKKCSGRETTFDSVISEPEKYAPRLSITDPFETVLGKNRPYIFQKELYDTPESSFLFAPCGRGKTEASLLWAIRALEKHHRDKIIFAMPTQTTSNAMYDRFCEIFGEESVGLFHGTSFIKLKSDDRREREEDKAEEKDAKEIRSETFKGNVFFKPITVTTVDHVLLSFVHGFSQADFALGNLMNSVIVFDEVHYYEKLTLEHIITLLDILNRMNIPHLLMSGTLPDFLISRANRIRERLKKREYPVIIDREGVDFLPFKIELKDEELTVCENPELAEEIVDNFRNGFTQFIIVNTVSRAKSFYTALLNGNLVEPSRVILYHSQFIFRDRVEKEKMIMKMYGESKESEGKKPFILVATQVIEISLNISCDIMYTELAPPDALGQRGGRLNRGKKSWKSGNIAHYLRIYRPPNPRPYYEDLMTRSEERIKGFTGAVSYLDIKKFCDMVYENYSPDFPSNLRYFFEEGVFFGPSYRVMRYGEDEGRLFKTRSEAFQTIDVIPGSIYEEAGDDALKKEFQAKIPLYILLSEVKEYGNPPHFYRVEKRAGKGVRNYWITSFPYSFEVGFNFDDPPASGAFIEGPPY